MVSSAQNDGRVQSPGVPNQDVEWRPALSTNLYVLVGVEIRVENNHRICCSEVDSRYE